jgi:hypothetical protein
MIQLIIVIQFIYMFTILSHPNMNNFVRILQTLKVPYIYLKVNNELNIKIHMLQISHFT